MTKTDIDTLMETASTWLLAGILERMENQQEEEHDAQE